MLFSESVRFENHRCFHHQVCKNSTGSFVCTYRSLDFHPQAFKVTLYEISHNDKRGSVTDEDYDSSTTSNNAILAFWLVLCISFTSHYTYVWPYMEINAANVNFFYEKLSFVDKKMDEKKINWVSCLQKKHKKLRTMQ